jgi:hypothetical protein
MPACDWPDRIKTSLIIGQGQQNNMMPRHRERQDGFEAERQDIDVSVFDGEGYHDTVSGN